MDVNYKWFIHLLNAFHKCSSKAVMYHGRHNDIVPKGLEL